MKTILNTIRFNRDENENDLGPQKNMMMINKNNDVVNQREQYIPVNAANSDYADLTNKNTKKTMLSKIYYKIFETKDYNNACIF